MTKVTVKMIRQNVKNLAKSPADLCIENVLFHTLDLLAIKRVWFRNQARVLNVRRNEHDITFL